MNNIQYFIFNSVNLISDIAVQIINFISEIIVQIIIVDSDVIIVKKIILFKLIFKKSRLYIL